MAPTSQPCSESQRLPFASWPRDPAALPGDWYASAPVGAFYPSLASRSSSLMPVACDRSGLPLAATRRRGGVRAVRFQWRPSRLSASLLAAERRLVARNGWSVSLFVDEGHGFG